MPRVNRASNDQLEFLVEATSIPEVSATTIAVNGQDAMGVVKEVPVRINFGSPFAVQVISDRDYTVYKSIREDWFDTLTSNGAANPFQINVVGSSQRMEYYDEVTGQITFEKLEQADGGYETVLRVVFNEAYPVRIGQLDFGSDKTDSYVSYSLEFAYSTYTIDNTVVPRLLGLL